MAEGSWTSFKFLGHVNAAVKGFRAGSSHLWCNISLPTAKSLQHAAAVCVSDLICPNQHHHSCFSWSKTKCFKEPSPSHATGTAAWPWEHQQAADLTWPECCHTISRRRFISKVSAHPVEQKESACQCCFMIRVVWQMVVKCFHASCITPNEGVLDYDRSTMPLVQCSSCNAQVPALWNTSHH